MYIITLFFFNDTATTEIYTLSLHDALPISTGSQKNQTYASVASVNSSGITPNNKYDRYNFNVRNTTSMLNDKMTLDVNASYIRQHDRNMINQGQYNNPLLGEIGRAHV